MTDLLKDTEAFLARTFLTRLPDVLPSVEANNCAADLLRRWMAECERLRRDRAEIEKELSFVGDLIQGIQAKHEAELAALRPYKEAWETQDKERLSVMLQANGQRYTVFAENETPLSTGPTPFAAVQNAAEKMKGNP